jgi:hypothetical protein
MSPFYVINNIIQNITNRKRFISTIVEIYTKYIL